MKKSKNIISVFITIIGLLIITTTKVDAATGTIKISSNTSKVVVGDNITFTVKVSSNVGLVALQYNISYDSSKLSLTSGNPAGAPVFNQSTKSATYTFKFKAKKSGTATFIFNAYGATWDGDAEVKLPSVSKSVTIITQKQLEDSYSKNNNLSSLSVENATLSPTFSQSITSYTVNLPANTETIKITGQKADSRSSVSGLGEHNVVDGKNTIKVIVTAENGATKTYTITAVVEELDPINVVIDTEEYTVIRKEKLLEPPSSDFTPTTVKINNEEVPSLTNDKLKLTIVGLKDSNGNIKLYIYDENNQTYTKYNQLSFKNLTLYIENKEVENTNNKEKFLINEETINGYTRKDDDFYYFYAINLETGKENLYRYDIDEETVQRTTPIENTKSNKKDEKNNDEIKGYQYIILGLIGFIFLTYIIILINLLRKNKKDKNNAIIIKEGRNNNSNKEKKGTINKVEEKTTNENNNKISEQEKDKLKKESQEELERINNEQTSETNEIVTSINELLINDNKKKKDKRNKKNKNKTDEK